MRTGIVVVILIIIIGSVILMYSIYSLCIGWQFEWKSPGNMFFFFLCFSFWVKIGRVLNWICVKIANFVTSAQPLCVLPMIWATSWYEFSMIWATFVMFLCLIIYWGVFDTFRKQHNLSARSRFQLIWYVHSIQIRKFIHSLFIESISIRRLSICVECVCMCVCLKTSKRDSDSRWILNW